MWWIYFNVGAEKANRRISHTSNPGRLARLAYTYLHLPLVAGIIVAAVGDSLTFEKPDAAVSTATGLAIVGGPVLYLLGNFLFKRATRASPAISHLAGMGALVLPFFVSGAMSTLGFSAAAALVLVVVAAWETASLGSARTKHRDALPSMRWPIRRDAVVTRVTTRDADHSAFSAMRDVGSHVFRDLFR